MTAATRTRQQTLSAQIFVSLIAIILFASSGLSQSNPPGFDDLVSRASAARDHNDPTQAVALYTQALELNPKWQDGWWFIGLLQYDAGAFGPARDALTRYIELLPKAGPAIALRGLCEFETGEYEESLRDIQHGVALGAANQPRNETILRYHEALLLTRTGKFDEALRSYAFFVRQEPNPELLLAIGLAALRTPFLPADIKGDQRDMFRAAGNASVLFMKGDEKGGRQEFQEFFRRFPTIENAHYRYGYFLFAIDPDEAAREFEQELQVAPANAPAQFMLAWDSLIRNNSAQALVYAKKGMAADPKIPGAQLIFGRALLESGDTRGGIEQLEKALALDPDNIEIHIALAKGYSKSGRREEARRERLLCLQLMKGETAPVATP